MGAILLRRFGEKEMVTAEDFRLGDWLVQPSLDRVSRGSQVASLQPRFMDLLVFLAQRPGKVVSKDDILQAVWGREFVAEGTLTHAVAVIRQTLGDDIHNPAFIETIPTRGYRLIAPVAPVEAGEGAVEPAQKTLLANLTARGGLIPLSIVAAACVLIAVWVVFRQFGWLFLSPTVGRAARVVVMPFANVGPPAQDYVALGITDDITTRLASVHGILVSARSSAARCAKEGWSPRRIAEELGIGYLVEGTVRWDEGKPEGRSLHVNAQLVRAVDDTLLWGGTYESDTADIGEVGALIAKQAIDQLGVRLRGAEQARIASMPTGDPDAYQAYLCGMRYHDLDDRDQLGLAASMFARATQLDPTFALAYAELSVVDSRIYARGIDPTPARLVDAEQAAKHALELRPALPAAHVALGVIQHLCRRDFAGALREYGIAARDLPNDGELMALIADVHRRQGKWVQARAEIERVVDTDPGNYSALLALGDTLSRMRLYTKAGRVFQRAINLAPDRVEPYLRRCWNDLLEDGSVARAERALADAPLPDDPQVALSRSYLRYLARDFAGALAALREVPDDSELAALRPASKSLLECVYLDTSGDEAASRTACLAALAELERRAEGNPPEQPFLDLGIARALAALGRTDEASRETERAADGCSLSKDAVDGATCMLERAEVLARSRRHAQAVALAAQLLSVPSPVSVHWLRLDPAFDALRGDSRFAALLAAPSERGS
jgi:DNA-binding winged helix-turn-helix (wHTH) protein/TolB-like protein